ncbi:peptide ligase PGM1-related protein [Bradyrhizobium brasilense]|uniref:preATP grasp domain-containing protein n=1 Tax=Bradyrhizobium brasilense TaxID=1419277 RepID=UPI0024B2354C|nr:peptide ligase PGM1-related protein [Bradyrhizobium australafricanum]WFU31433.1 peptide ligase PGM1-related protein [Bradyrhizobium australafricanum]
MPTIIVMNNATEQMLGQRLDRQQALFAAQAATRNVWLARPGDVVVATRRPGDDFLSYMAAVPGWQTQDGKAPVRFVTPATGAASVVLNDEVLLDQRTIETLRRAIGAPDEWSMLACYQTAGTARLQEELRLGASGGQAIARRHAAHFGTDLLNRKSHFRQFAVGTGLPIPEGAIVAAEADFRRVIDALLPLTGNVMVKLDNGAGGTGNIVLSEAETGPFAGAFRWIRLPAANGDERTEMISALWQTLRGRSSGPLVVEAYHPADAMFYLEFLIRPDGQAEFLDSGSIRLRRSADPAATSLFWTGLQLPAALPPARLAEATLHCGRLLQLAAMMGYRGHINIDAIITTDNRLLFNEANARWGGGTVLHEVASRLLGSGFTASHVAASFRDVPSPGFGRLVALLERSGLAFSAGNRCGIVVLACDDVNTHTFEALVIAPGSNEARAMEQRLLEMLRHELDVAA